MAIQLIEQLADDFDPSKYKDEYQAKLRAIIKAKAKGKPLPVDDTEAPDDSDVLDLVSRLQQSLAAGAPKSARKKTAKKSSAKKSARKRKSA